MKPTLCLISMLVPVGLCGMAPEEIAVTRPDPEGVPTQVRIAPYVIDIGTIDNAQQQFSIDLVLSLEWKDARLAGPRARRLPLQQVWHPQAYLFNQRNVRTFLPELVDVGTDGTVFYTQRYYGNLGALLDLRAFPFDRQSLPITVVSFAYSPDEVQFVLEARYAGRAERFSNADWDIGQGTGTVSRYRAVAGHAAGQEHFYSRFDYVLPAKRYLSYYVWKVIGPLVIIVLMSWAVFYIDPSLLGPQLGLAGTSILTLIAFLFSLRGILPPISYLTRLDYFVYASLVLVFVAFLEALSSGFLSAQGRHETAKSLDRVSRIAFPFCFIAVNVWFWFLG